MTNTRSCPSRVNTTKNPRRRWQVDSINGLACSYQFSQLSSRERPRGWEDGNLYSVRLVHLGLTEGPTELKLAGFLLALGVRETSPSGKTE